MTLQKSEFRTLPVTKMSNSDGQGSSLLKQGPFAADLIHFAAGEGVAAHTHPGNHMLFVVSGRGKLIYAGVEYSLAYGDCYLVPGYVVHAVRADDDCDLLLLGVADDHRPIDSPERLEMVHGTH